MDVHSVCLRDSYCNYYFCKLQTHKEKMDTIEEMLNVAVKGEFTEGQFDETRMSALETKFAHYLSASALSAQNVEAEKDKIKALIADISFDLLWKLLFK